MSKGYDITAEAPGKTGGGQNTQLTNQRLQKRRAQSSLEWNTREFHRPQGTIEVTVRHDTVTGEDGGSK